MTFLILPLIALCLFYSHLVTAFSDVTIYSPPSSYKIPRVLYARSLLLAKENVILATWENYGPEPPYFPIYQSSDQGRTWSEIGRVKDEVNGWGLRYQPFLYELPIDYGGFPAGTILCAGSSIPSDLSKTQLELYASQDRGRTWKFVSHIARGGVAKPDNGLTPVWEPFLMMYKERLIYYYSDQRDGKHGQKLDHQISDDLRKWEPPVDDVSYSNYKGRPGMTTIAHLPNGQYMLTYEYCGAPQGGCPVYYRLSADPLKFQSAQAHQLKTPAGGNGLSGSPYVVWTPAGGPNGTIVVSSGGHPEVFLNRNLGAPGSEWKKVPTGAQRSYTRSLMVMTDPKNILIVGAGLLNGANNKVTAATIDVSR
ncbi:BNR/Asp-box repeat protein [Tothia fuscella]|uniref:BNR/Asp-box repeat protein n=1 Tax=Tothia fuscella TaxID=1048955 RepID=A0A9P4NW54_9PEZI|nr:BNR/Asp-box repeat protein [Tothia fuscella]